MQKFARLGASLSDGAYLKLSRRGLNISLKRDTGGRHYVSNLSKRLFHLKHLQEGLSLACQTLQPLAKMQKTNPTDATPSSSKYGQMTTSITNCCGWSTPSRRLGFYTGHLSFSCMRGGGIPERCHEAAELKPLFLVQLFDF